MPRRVLMTVSTTPDWLKETTLIRDLKALLSEEKESEDHMWTFLQRLRMQEITNTDVYSLVPLFIVFEQVIRDTAYFLQEASDQIRKIVSFILPSFRRSPDFHSVFNCSNLKLAVISVFDLANIVTA